MVNVTGTGEIRVAAARAILFLEVATEGIAGGAAATANRESRRQLAKAIAEAAGGRLGPLATVSTMPDFVGLFPDFPPEVVAIP